LSGGESREGGRGSKIPRLRLPPEPENQTDFKVLDLKPGSHGSKCLQDCSNLRLSWFHNAAHLQLDPKVDGWEGSKGQGQPERISLAHMMVTMI